MLYSPTLDLTEIKNKHEILLYIEIKIHFCSLVFFSYSSR